MDRTSDFVRPNDVLDPDRSAIRPEEVDYDDRGNLVRRSVVTLVCIAGVVGLAALQPHARHFTVVPPAAPSALHH